MEGYLFGVPAIAFSQVQKGWAHLESAARKARDLVAFVMEHRLAQASPFLLNVNIPNLPYDELKPFKVSRLGRRHAAEKVMSQASPRGEMMYWIGGAGPAKDDAEGTDFHATTQGHVSITPLKVDLTDHEALSDWGAAASRLGGREGRG
jgi:5'-nucleotidase